MVKIKFVYIFLVKIFVFFLEIFSSEFLMDQRIANPIAITLTAVLAITITLILQEHRVEWIHSVWVVITIALLADFEKPSTSVSPTARPRKLVRAMAAIIIGLVIGVVAGLIVRTVYTDDCPRGVILVIQVLVQSSLFFASAIVAQRSSRVSGTELSYTCAFASFCLFAPTSSLALARIVAVLFACAVTLLVESLKYLIIIRSSTQSSVRHRALVDKALGLATKVIRGHESDKEEIEKIASDIRESLETESSKNDSKLLAHIRTLVFECYSLYWSLMASSATPFLGQKSTLFCQSEEQFNYFFKSSIDRIEDGLDEIRNHLHFETDDDRTSATVSRVVHEFIANNFVEGMQGFEFHLTQAKGHSSMSPGQRWHMAAYLVNLGAILVSVIDLVRVILADQLPKETSEQYFSSLSDSMTRISGIQKMGSMGDLLILATPTILSRQTSSAVSPIRPATARTLSLDHGNV